MRILSILFLTIAFVSCTNTKFTYHSGKPVLQSGHRMLLTNFKGFNSIQASELAEDTRDKLIEDLYTVSLPEVEYDLLKEGLAYDSLYAETLSIGTKKKIKDILNVRYLMDVELLNAKSGGSYGSYTNNQLNQYNEPYSRNDEVNNASVLFTIVDMEQPSRQRSFTVSVSINPLVLPDDEGEQRINATSKETASSKAYIKGIKKIKKSIFD